MADHLASDLPSAPFRPSVHHILCFCHQLARVVAIGHKTLGLPPSQDSSESTAAGPPTIVLTASADDESDDESVIQVADPADDDVDDQWRAAAVASDEEDDDLATWPIANNQNDVDNVAAACEAVRRARGLAPDRSFVKSQLPDTPSVLVHRRQPSPASPSAALLGRLVSLPFASSLV